MKKLFGIFNNIIKKIRYKADKDNNIKTMVLSEEFWISIDLENNLDKVSNDYLVEIVKKMGDYENVSTALSELSNRKDERYEELNYEILLCLGTTISKQTPLSIFPSAASSSISVDPLRLFLLPCRVKKYPASFIRI